MKKWMLLAAICLLSACASLERRCDCSCNGKETRDNVKTSHSSGGAAVVPPAPQIEEEKTVSAADIESINKMIKAVDDYVFREKKEEFTTLCKDPRFDCSVNEKRFPAGKKAVKRKISPFVSGSKTGLQNSERITVRYSFYP